jgi:adenylylsulfate kinase
MLDGDVLRERLCKDLGYSKEDRKENIDRAMFVAELLARNGVAVIASFISPHAELRDNGKQTINNFVEAYVKCSIEECERRDPKGLYKKVRNGEIDNFTGIDDLYEEPLNPDLVLETEFHPIEYSVKLLIDYLVDNKLLPQI